MLHLTLLQLPVCLCIMFVSTDVTNAKNLANNVLSSRTLLENMFTASLYGLGQQHLDRESCVERPSAVLLGESCDPRRNPVQALARASPSADLSALGNGPRLHYLRQHPHYHWHRHRQVIIGAVFSIT
jgi:hypothetical protein